MRREDTLKVQARRTPRASSAVKAASSAVKAARAEGRSPSGELSLQLEHVTLISLLSDRRPAADLTPFKALLEEEEEGCYRADSTPSHWPDEVVHTISSCVSQRLMQLLGDAMLQLMAHNQMRYLLSDSKRLEVLQTFILKSPPDIAQVLSCMINMCPSGTNGSFLIHSSYCRKSATMVSGTGFSLF